MPPFLEKTDVERISLENPLEFPGNNQRQVKTGLKFNALNRNIVLDWDSAYFNVEYRFEALADGANVGNDDQTAPINGSFSLIKSLTVKSSGSPIYEVSDISRTANSTVTAPATTTNKGISARHIQSRGAGNVKIVIPLNHFSFLEELWDKLLPSLNLEILVELQDDNNLIFQNDATGRRIVVKKMELWVPRLQFSPEGQKRVNEQFFKPIRWHYLQEQLSPSGAVKDASGVFRISPGVKNPRHVFVFIQQPNRTTSITKNPYFFDTFNIDGDNSAKLASCRLKYGANYYPDLRYETHDLIHIYNDLIDFNHRKNNPNTGTQIDVNTFSSLYPVIYFDLRAQKETMTGDPMNMELEFSLNEAATQDYKIFAAILFEKEFVIVKNGTELVVQ